MFKRINIVSLKVYTVVIVIVVALGCLPSLAFASEAGAERQSLQSQESCILQNNALNSIQGAKSTDNECKSFATAEKNSGDCNFRSSDDELEGATDGLKISSSAAANVDDAHENTLPASEDEPFAFMQSNSVVHIQNTGDTVGQATNDSNGNEVYVFGTVGQALRLESFALYLDTNLAGSIEYRSHIQNIGWESMFSKDGERSGTIGRALRLEAIQIQLTGELAEKYDIYYRVHVQNMGWLSWASNGMCAGSEGYAYRIEAIEISLVKKNEDKTSAAPTTSTEDRSCSFYKYSSSGYGLVNYATHVQNMGWQPYESDGDTAGTTGECLRVEAIKINLSDTLKTTYPDSGITYSTHVQNIGNQEAVFNNDIAGTTGASCRIEALRVNLTGTIADDYDIYYRVHVANIGWLDWAKNYEWAGTSSSALRVEAIQVKLKKKSEAAPGKTAVAYLTPSQVLISAKALVENEQWAQNGTTGESRPLTGMLAFVQTNQLNISGSISYKGHFSNVGWTEYCSENTQLTQSGNNLEAISIKLTEELADYYDVYYRVHASGYGWTGWARNGANCGSVGCCRAIESYEVQVVPHGGYAPGSTSNTFSDENGFLAQKAAWQRSMDSIAASLWSATDWLLVVDTNNCAVGVYAYSDGCWNNYAYWDCGPGADVSPTVKGSYEITNLKMYYFDSGSDRCFYATQFYGDYLFHSVLYRQDPTPEVETDGRVGARVSHGCVRMKIDKAKWIYDYIPAGTKVYIY